MGQGRCYHKGKKARRKKALFLGQDLSLQGKGQGRGFIMQITPFSSGGRVERGHRTDYFLGADQKIPDWLIKANISGEG